jgi:hypothetical protein
MLGTKRFLLVNIQRDHGVMFHIVRRFLADVKLVKIKVTCAQARDQIRELVGEIRLVVTPRGYLAQMTGRYAGLVKLTVGGELKMWLRGSDITGIFSPAAYCPAINPLCSRSFQNDEKPSL